jgi:hypothetical protein
VSFTWFSTVPEFCVALSRLVIVWAIPLTSYVVATCKVPESVFVPTVVTQSLVRLRKWG